MDTESCCPYTSQIIVMVFDPTSSVWLASDVVSSCLLLSPPPHLSFNMKYSLNKMSLCASREEDLKSLCQYCSFQRNYPSEGSCDYVPQCPNRKAQRCLVLVPSHHYMHACPGRVPLWLCWRWCLCIFGHPACHRG